MEAKQTPKKIELIVGIRQKGETKKAILGCNDYLLLGPGRSVAKLHRQYKAQKEQTETKPPTVRFSTLADWSRRFRWQERSEVYDAVMQEQRQKHIEAERDKVLGEGLALEHERLKVLYDLAARIQAKIEAAPKPDARDVGALRGVLDDIAKETGGRVVRQEMHSTQIITPGVYLPKVEDDE